MFEAFNDNADVFYIVDGAPKSIADIIRMKRADRAGFNAMMRAGEILGTKDPTRLAQLQDTLKSLGVAKLNMATLVGLPTLDQYDFDIGKLTRPTPDDVAAYVREHKLQYAQKVLLPGLRAIKVTYNGEELVEQIADHTAIVAYDFNPPKFGIKADHTVLAVIRDLRYALPGDLAEHPYITMWEQASTFAKEHYYGTISFEFSMARYRKVREESLMVRRMTGNQRVFRDFGAYLRDPSALHKAADHYSQVLAEIHPPAKLHAGQLRVWKRIVDDPQYAARKYALTYIVDQYADYYTTIKESTDEDGNLVYINKPSNYQLDVSKNYRTAGREFGDEAGVAKLLDLAVGTDVQDRVSGGRWCYYVVQTRSFGISLKAQASAGPLYDDRKHSEVGVSEIYNATSMMMFWGGIEGSSLAANIPASSDQAERERQMINSYRLYELKPKPEVYHKDKRVERNILVPSTTSQLPMSVFSNMTQAFDRHLLNSRSTSMLRMPLTAGNTDLFLKLGSLRQGGLVCSMSDNSYIFARKGKYVALLSADVAKAEGSLSPLMMYVGNRRMLAQMGHKSGIVLEGKTATSGALNLKKGKKSKRLVRVGAEDDAPLAGRPEVKPVEKEAVFMSTSKSAPVGWQQYMLYFYPQACCDVNVAVRTHQLPNIGMPSGILLTAYLNNLKSLYSQSAMQELVAKLLPGLPDGDPFYSEEGRQKLSETMTAALDSPGTIASMELHATLEAVCPLTDSQGEWSTRGRVLEADLLGYDLLYVEPPAPPGMFIPVLRWKSLMGLLLFHKFDRKLDAESENFVLTRNVMTMVSLKVAYFSGAWAYPAMAAWVNQALRRMYTAYPDLRVIVDRLSDANLNEAMERVQANKEMDLLGTSITSLLRKPYPTQDDVWRVHGHGKSAYVNDDGVVISPAGVVKAFKDFVPVTAEDSVLNTVAMFSRRFISSHENVQWDMTEQFGVFAQMYYDYLQTGKVAIPAPEQVTFNLVAGGKSFAQRMKKVTAFVEGIEGVERGEFRDMEDFKFLYSVAEPVTSNKVKIGSKMVGRSVVNHHGVEVVVEDMRDVLDADLAEARRGPYQPVAVRPSTVGKDPSRLGAHRVLTPAVKDVKATDVYKSLLAQTAREWAVLVRGPLSRKGVAREPGPLYAAFRDLMPRFVKPGGKGFYEGRHNTKIAILNVYAYVERKKGEKIDVLKPTRLDMAAQFADMEAWAGKHKDYSHLPEEIQNAAYPAYSSESKKTFITTVIDLLQELYAEEPEEEVEDLEEVVIRLPTAPKRVFSRNWASDDESEEKL